MKKVEIIWLIYDDNFGNLIFFLMKKKVFGNFYLLNLILDSM